jgi:hypothetical protein
MSVRTVEDRLREQYFDLLPAVRRVLEHVEAEVRYRLLPVSRSLRRFEQVIIESRVKGCESAIEALRNRQDFSTFNLESAEGYTLASLKDLAGVRILAFPRNRVREIDGILRDAEVFRSWTSDPVLGADDKTVAFKYWGYYGPASTEVLGEYQVVSRLTGRFWEVEHSAMYKAAPTLKDAVEAPRMQEQYRSVLREIAKFEDEFERLLGMDPAPDR